MPAARGYFNPRSPHGERRISSRNARSARIFQSTLPARGATFVETPEEIGASISIHAPRTGSDPVGVRCARALKDFNPRSPHGERQPCASSPATVSVFQSTLPARGATELQRRAEIADVVVFQSTLPARGATAAAYAIGVYRQFQSTLPARGATIQRFTNQVNFLFQSTLPARGAT